MTKSGQKKVRFTRRPQRRQRAQKRRQLEQHRILGQAVLDRADRGIWCGNWQRERVTLSSIIVPKASPSSKNELNVAIKPQKKEAMPKIAAETKTAKRNQKKAAKKEKQENQKNNMEKSQKMELKILENVETVKEDHPVAARKVESKNAQKTINTKNSMPSEQLHLENKIEIKKEPIITSPVELTPLTIDTHHSSELAENCGSDCEKCSIDSGVEITGNLHGNPMESECLLQSSPSAQLEAEYCEEPKKVPKVDKQEKRVYELQQVADRMEIQTTLVVNTEAIAPFLQPLKVEPLNLERIQLVEKKAPKKKPRQYKLLDSDIEYCRYMDGKYGQDYEAMSRDERNLFKDSPKSIERKLRIYKDYLKQIGTTV